MVQVQELTKVMGCSMVMVDLWMVHEVEVKQVVMMVVDQDGLVVNYYCCCCFLMMRMHARLR